MTYLSLGGGVPCCLVTMVPITVPIMMPIMTIPDHNKHIAQ